MHQRLRVMGLTVLAVAASAVLLGGSSASHAELAGGPALTQNSDPVGLMACNLLAIQILENFDTRLDVSATGKRVLKPSSGCIAVYPTGRGGSRGPSESRPRYCHSKQLRGWSILEGTGGSHK